VTEESEEVQLAQKAMNPIIWADVPDPDVIRVGEFYYMVSTTMHLTPGVPVMRSVDLVNWELITYVYDILEDNDKYNLVGGDNAYGRGSWAASLRHHKGLFYVSFASLDMNRTYIYQTADITNGPWERSILPGLYHDSSLLFDEDGRVYLVHGNGTIRITELNEDARSIKPGGVDQVLINTVKKDNRLNSEGSHFYKINGTYYLFLIEWPDVRTMRRIVWCHRSDTLLGKYEGRVVLDDNFFYGNNGVAQGGIIETPERDWYAMLFQDHGAVGRIPILVPVHWEEGWPMMGIGGKVPVELNIPTQSPSYEIVVNDEFDSTENKLKLPWQWNHNPDNSLWSVTDRPGYLRLTTGAVVPNILSARNTLSQRTLGPVFTFDTKMVTTGMKQGDYAGIAAYQSGYGLLGVKAAMDGRKFLIVADNEGTGNPREQVSFPLEQEEVYLRIQFIFNNGEVRSLTEVDQAYFYYSYDGLIWNKLDYVLPMKYTLDHFMGYRAALFCYATIQTGGYADFDYFHYRTGQIPEIKPQ
jgi:beta-xylosidase